MADYLKSYNLTIETLTPVHVGSGNSLDGMEYIVDEEAKLINVLNYQAIVSDPTSRHKVGLALDDLLAMQDNRVYRKFLSEAFGKRGDLFKWSFWASDKLCTDLKRASRVGQGAIALMPFNGQNYYIPGSGIKGAIRTAYLDHFASGAMGIRERSDLVKKLEVPHFTKTLNDEKLFHLLMCTDTVISWDDIFADHIDRLYVKDEKQMRRDIPNNLLVIKSRVTLKGGNISFQVGKQAKWHLDQAWFSMEKMVTMCNRYYRPHYERDMEKYKLRNDFKCGGGTFLLNIGGKSGGIVKTLNSHRMIHGVRGKTKLEDIKTRFFSGDPPKINPLGWVLCTLEE